MISFTLNAQISINEILASNASTNVDPLTGEYSDWIELYNASPADVNLSNWTLTDDADEPSKWTFPVGTIIKSRQFILVWADGRNNALHTNFKLSSAGERVLLFNPSGSKIDQYIFGEQKTDISIGRETDGAINWAYFTQATPGKSNNKAAHYTDYVITVPYFTITGGFYSKAITLEIKKLSPEPGELRYTLDGSTPSLQSPLFTKAINITKTTVVKARVFRTNQIPGPIITNTYFINENFAARGLAVLSLSGEPDYFWAADSGLLKNHNAKPDWEYPIHLEFYEKDGILGFHHDAGGSVGGQNSWVLPQKLINISSRKQYGGGSIAYQIFPDNPRKEFEDIILRTSGNDWSNTYFRDAMQQRVASATSDLDVQSMRPVACFVNGVYYGLYNIREKQDKDYIAYHHHIDPDKLDYIENGGDVKEGNDSTYQALVAVLNSGISSNAKFQEFEKKVDVDNYTDYIISQIFCSNSSYGHNVSLFKGRADSARWRWLLHDYDRGFTSSTGTGMDFFTSPNGNASSNPPYSTLMLRKMFLNANYKEKFISRFADHLYVTWNPNFISPRINLHSAWIENEIPIHIAKWQGTTSTYGNAMPSVAYWENEVQQLHAFAKDRNAWMWDDLNSFFSLKSYTNLQTEISAPAHGYVSINGLDIPAFPWRGKYFINRPFTLTAKAKPGFVFDHWEKKSSQEIAIISANSTWKYYDQASAPPSNWAQTSFSDAAWSSGKAELGYGDGDEATVISYGSNASNKIPSYFFRQSFNIDDVTKYSELNLKMVIDDGAVVYLNGTEIWRYNMGTATPIKFTDLATAATADESIWHEAIIPITSLIKGKNVIAVEVHQATLASADISFNASLSGVVNGTPIILAKSESLSYKLDSLPTNIRAVFVSNGSCGILADSIKTNTVLLKSCSPYLAAGNVYIANNTSLIIEAGVEIWMPEKAQILVEGKILAQGTKELPILIKNNPANYSWSNIIFKNTTDTSILNYMTIEHATADENRIYFPAAISLYNSKIIMDHMTMIDVYDNPIYARFSDVRLTNSIIKSTVTGDGINVKQGKGYIENCEFIGGTSVDMDAIDYDGVIDGVIKNNIVHDFRGDNNDGIDIGEQCVNLSLEHNFIYHCYDKGISVGQQSTGTIRDNTIAYTAIGVALKDQSIVTLDHNTLFGNDFGIYAYEKNPGSLGGSGIITNCIVSNAATASYIADSLSSITVTNSLSDPDEVKGTNNILADPKFVNPTLYNFNLLPGSQAIGAGSNASNLGAINIPVYKDQPQLLISEIMYDDSLSLVGEFIEIYNPGANSVALSGYSIIGSIDFEFPSGSRINPGEYIIIARNASLFISPSFQVFQWASGKLSNQGEQILFYDNNGLLIDMVRYNNHAPWPEFASLQGKSLELISANLDNHFATSWIASKGLGGTPGRKVITNNETLLTDFSFEVFPNPGSDYIMIALDRVDMSDVSLHIIDELGNVIVAQALKNKIEKINIINLNPGIYSVNIQSNQQAINVSRRFIKVK